MTPRLSLRRFGPDAVLTRYLWPWGSTHFWRRVLGRRRVGTALADAIADMWNRRTTRVVFCLGGSPDAHFLVRGADR